MTSKAFNLATRAGVDGALSNRNKIINGAFRVDQRNSGAATTLQSGYTVDRFRVHGPLANMFTVQRQAKGVRVTRNAGTANFGHFGTPLEQQDLLPFLGQQMTLSFLARGSANISTITRVVDTPSPTSGTSNLVSEQPLEVTTGWERKVFAVTMPNTLEHACVYLSLFSAQDGIMSAGQWIEIDEVQFEAGDTATPFEHRSFGQELALCQRYYQTLINSPLRMYVRNVVRDPKTISPEMRATPTLTKTFPSGVTNLNVDSSSAQSPRSWVVDLQIVGFGEGVIDTPIYTVIASAEL